MKRMLFKTVSIVLSLMMVLAMFTACGSNNSAEPSVDEIVDAAVKAAMDASVTSITVTIEVDGQQFTIEGAEGKSVQQLLDQAGITLNEGDVLSVSPGQTLTENITIQVLRRNTVTVVITGADDQEDARHIVVLMGGTVADALAVLGIEVTEDQIVNFELTQALENGMEIIISAKPEQETEATEPNNSDSGSGSGSGSGSDSGSGSGNASETEPDSGNERYVVSVVYYEDCDGSGHGIMVITYSDGTQEEVPY